MSRCNFPWLFSNVVDASWRKGGAADTKIDDRDSQILVTLPYFVMDVKGIRVGCVGLVEEYVQLGLSDF